MNNWIEFALQVLAGVIILTGVGAWLLKKGAHLIADKVEQALEKVALALNGVAVTARSAGLDKIADVVEEIADVPDELGDVAAKIEEMTKNQEFTKEKFLELWKEGKDVAVEAKDFWIKVVKKE